MKRVLIANRGEIALRIIRACRLLGVGVVTVHSEVDEESLHVRFADDAICIGPGDPRQSYLNIPSLLSAAEISGADAIHPGYGFLAESAAFAGRCEEVGLKFIGPDAALLDTFGDKLKTRELMESKGFSSPRSELVAGNDSSAAARIAAELGYPLMIKALNAGGGRGMRRVSDPAMFVQAFEAAITEVGGANGDSRILLEEIVEGARHIEVQFAFDAKGDGITLGTRDCTLQRRYQKVLEEAPAHAIHAEQRLRLCAQTLEALQGLGYVTVGTAEFLVTPEGEVKFLEINPRLQVEHTVTEMITGIDLVVLQMKLANRLPLELKQSDVEMRGHAIECRLLAETPFDFLPCAGRVKAYHVAGGTGVRVDSALFQDAVVPPHYDPLIAKLVVWGADRDTAIRRARAALDETVIEGIDTNIELHRFILDRPEFRKGDIHTKSLEQWAAKKDRKALDLDRTAVRFGYKSGSVEVVYKARCRERVLCNNRQKNVT